jgi:hypothetical protein
MKQDEIPNVVNVGFFGFEAEMLKAKRLPDLIESAGGDWGSDMDGCWIMPVYWVLIQHKCRISTQISRINHQG